MSIAAEPIQLAQFRSQIYSLEALVAEIALRREEFDRLRHVPRDVVAKMKLAGIYRATTPKCFGGDAVPPAEFLQVVERIAQSDGSAAWVAAFGSANIYLASLPHATQRTIYAGGPDQVFAGGLYPMHKAVEAPGGWRVTGQWRWASGCMGADWIGVGLGVAGEAGPDGRVPLIARMGVSPAREVEIIPNWDVVGMQGSGSFDTRVEDKFYPVEWTCARDASGVIDEPLFRYPALAYQAEVHAAVNIGLARAALDLAAERGGETNTSTGAPRLADRAYYRLELARAEAKWRALRAFYYEQSEQAWQAIMAGDEVTAEQRTLLRLSATHAAHGSAEVIQVAYRIAGIAAIEKSNRLQQIVRDSMVVTQHALLADGTWEGAGAMLVGAKPPMAFP